MQEEELLLDPEEQTERKLVHNMALAIVVMVAGLILILAIRPWIQRFRDEQQEMAGGDASSEIDVSAAEN